MTCRITVWTPVTDQDSAGATALLRHLDAQTSPTSEWELVLAVPEGADPGRLERLERLAERRPNVRVVVDGDGREQAHGEWVLELAPDDRLEPAALRRLVDLASEAGSPEEIVVRPERAALDEMVAPLVLRRSEQEAQATNGSRVSVERLVPTPLRAPRGPWSPEPTSLLTGVTAQVRWVDGVLEVDGRAPLHAAGAARADLVLVGRHRGDVRSLPVDTFTVSGDDEDSEPELVWSARVVITSADADDELEVWLRAEPAETDETGVDGTPAAEPALLGKVGAPPTARLDAPAVLDGRLVCARADDDTLVVDVGARGRSLLGHLDPREASVVEDPRGSLLTLMVPQLARRGPDRVIKGALLFDERRLPAHLVVDEEPRIECLLAFPPGSAALECSFGPGPAAATDCSVVTSRTGEYTVVATPAGSGTTAAASELRRPTKPQASGPVAALRRRLPDGVDPVLSRLSRVPALRAAYRRVTGLP